MWLFSYHPREPRTRQDAVARFVGGPLDGVEISLPSLPFTPDAISLQREGGPDCKYVLSPDIGFIGSRPVPLLQYHYRP